MPVSVTVAGMKGPPLRLNSTLCTCWLSAAVPVTASVAPTVRLTLASDNGELITGTGGGVVSTESRISTVAVFCVPKAMPAGLLSVTLKVSFASLVLAGLRMVMGTFMLLTPSPSVTS